MTWRMILAQFSTCQTIIHLPQGPGKIGWTYRPFDGDLCRHPSHCHEDVLGLEPLLGPVHEMDLNSVRVHEVPTSL